MKESVSVERDVTLATVTVCENDAEGVELPDGVPMLITFMVVAG